MFVYTGTKSDFFRDVETDAIDEIIEKRVYEVLGRRTGPSEMRSWKNSLSSMYYLLRNGYVPDDAGIAIEYTIPMTSKRIDFMISGYDKIGERNVVVIELKQWETAESVEGFDALVNLVINRTERHVPHPSYQVWTYACLLNNYIENIEKYNIHLDPVVFLHNYKEKEIDPLLASQYKDYLNEAPVFNKHHRLDLLDLIQEKVQTGDSFEILDSIEKSRIRPSPSLQREIVRMLQNQPVFQMIDDQKVVFEELFAAAKKSAADGKKRVFIIKGGPGTGKSVIAVNLLCKLTNIGLTAQYVSKNIAPRNVYDKMLTQGGFKNSYVTNLFRGSGCFIDKEENAISALIVDEAHRLNEKSGNTGNSGDNQIREIIKTGKFSVFFVDDNQIVTIKDIGRSSEIRKIAKELKCEITELVLESQFRCNGSSGYLSWLDNTLKIQNTANWDLKGINYDFKVFDSPEKLYEAILEKDRIGNSARLVAGYCWNWEKKYRNDPEHADIVIGNFSISWNLKDGTPFAIDDFSIKQAGCIHTVQGLEFDYIGVIIGNDLRFEEGELYTDFRARARTDASLKGIKTLYKKNPAEADRIADETIKNTYRTLMTRGMKGCYIYCTDPALAQYFKECKAGCQCH